MQLYAHISIDDVSWSLADIVSQAGKYTSIYESDIFRFLRKLHDRYGARFTLYAYTRNTDFELKDIPERFRQEFREASDWLKFGFHWVSNAYNPSISEQLIADECDRFYSIISRTISPESLSHTIRLHYYHPSATLADSLGKLEWFKSGLTLLCADTPERISYDLNASEVKSLCENKIIEKNGRLYIKTDIRIENNKVNLKDFYNQPYVVIFTHEWALTKENFRGTIGRLFRRNGIPPAFTTRRRMTKLIRSLHNRSYTFLNT